MGSKCPSSGVAGAGVSRHSCTNGPRSGSVKSTEAGVRAATASHRGLRACGAFSALINGSLRSTWATRYGATLLPLPLPLGRPFLPRGGRETAGENMTGMNSGGRQAKELWVGGPGCAASPIRWPRAEARLGGECDVETTIGSKKKSHQKAVHQGLSQDCTSNGWRCLSRAPWCARARAGELLLQQTTP